MGRWAQRRRSGTDRTAALTAIVTSVQKTGANQLTWNFNVNVLSDGAAETTLVDISLGGSGIPTSTVQGGAKSVIASYAGAVNVGNNYGMGGVPTHVSNPNGSGFTVPQSGNVT